MTVRDDLFTNATPLPSVEPFPRPIVEADVGIIIGHSKSLITECERSGVLVLDVMEQDNQQATVNTH